MHYIQTPTGTAMPCPSNRAQGLVDEIQRAAFLLNKEGYDVAQIFEETRRLNKQLVEASA